MASITANLSTSLNGSIKIAGDKSISHRSIILGALSIGETTVEGLLESQDILATISAMQAFGAEIEKKADKTQEDITINSQTSIQPDDEEILVLSDEIAGEKNGKSNHFSPAVRKIIDEKKIENLKKSDFLLKAY